jgi:hypothetical protein
MTLARTLTLAETGVRKFEVVEAGTCYRLHAAGVGVVLELDRLAWKHDELGGELTARVGFAGTEAVEGVLSVASFNVSSARARTERAQLLHRQSRASDIPWHALIEEICQRTLTAERVPEPAKILRQIDRPDPSEQFLHVFGFLLPRNHPAILFGDGGSAKSYLALYLGGLLADEGYRVLLCDWELDGSDHRDRLERLFGDNMPNRLLYTRCSRPLIQEGDRIKRLVRDEGIDYRVHDSIGYACHDKPESSDAALRYMQADRRIGGGSLHIAHVNRQETGDDRPFGSTFWHNSARATYNIKASDDGADGLTVALFHRKANLGRRLQPFGISVTFEADRTVLKRCDLAETEGFAEKLSVRQRMQSLLKSGALTIAQIADELGVAVNTITVTVKRGSEGDRRWLTRVPGPDGVFRIGLLAR